MGFEIIKLDREKIYKKWSSFLNTTDGKTIFHSFDFLSYHKDRFNEHHLGVVKGEQLFGIIPMAVNKGVAKSPYGASYGGFLFNKALSYSDSKEIVKIFLQYITNIGIREIFITPPLGIYYEKEYSQTFLFAMREEGFSIINSDITSVVTLVNDVNFTSKSRNMARKALKFEVKVEFKANLDDYWLLMEKTFTKLKKSPTHSKDEYNYLMQQLPNSIYVNVAYIKDIPVAGMGVFEINSSNIMSFYLCSDEEYKHTQAMSLLIQETILDSKNRGFKYFDFGTSSINMKASDGIFKFKESFGAIGLFRDTYYWKA